MQDILSYEQVRDGIRDVINRHPEGVDHTYSRPEGAGVCLYVHNDGPSCIVGHYLINVLGVAKCAIEEREGIGVSSLAKILRAEGAMPGLDFQASVFLNVVQAEQDSGAPWGEAYETALSYIKDRQEEE